MQINSNQFPKVYESLGITIADLGCVMLDVEVPNIGAVIPDAVLYKSDKADRWWIDGYVFGKNPHMTLLYGLLQPAAHWKEEIAEVMKGWSIESVKVQKVGFFESPFEDDPYYCIIAHVEPSLQIAEGMARLELLPHINTYADYVPHITIAYVKKNDTARTSAIRYFDTALRGRKLKVKKELNLGGLES